MKNDARNDPMEAGAERPQARARRNFIATALGAGAGLAAAGLVGGATAQAQETATAPATVPAAASPAADGDVTIRSFPRSGERVPAIGLGTFMTFDALPGAPRDGIAEVLRRFWQAGGRVVDTSPLYGMAEVNVGHLAGALGIGDQLFVSNKVWATGDYLADDSHAERSLDLSRARLWRERIDLVQCHSLVNVDVIVPLLQAWKKEGRIRYLGVTHHDPAYFGPLASWVESGQVDVVQVHYSILTRQAEERVLPAAIDQGVAVNVNMPLEKARLHHLVQGRPLPDFARELGIDNWSAYFLKWVISHPAITCALPATTNPAHLAENMAALRGPLPDRAMRERMLRHMQAIPGFDRLAETPWYPGKTFRGVIGNAQQALRQRS